MPVSRSICSDPAFGPIVHPFEEFTSVLREYIENISIRSWRRNILHKNGYLAGAGIKDTSAQRTWAFLGDGEMDEPESRGMLQLAANQQLDNLTFVINCNLQRLDGPVRGNGKIIQELEASTPVQKKSHDRLSSARPGFPYCR